MGHYLAAAFLAVAAAGSMLAQAEPTLAITNVAVVDVTKGAARSDQTVLIAGNRIVSVGPAATTRVPAGATVVNGSRKFLIPGLWDMHSHVVGFGPTSLQLYLAHGVTSIRDMGAERFADAKAWRDRITAGELLGPRMRIASPIVENARWLAAVKRAGERAGTPWRLYERFAPTSAAEAVSWVDSIAALRPDHIKVRNWPAPEIGHALVERARERGLPVVGHGNEPFPRKGVATLEHQIWPPLTISKADRDSLWRDLAASGTALVPTLVTWPIRLDPPDAVIAKVNSGSIAGLQYVPATTREQWRNQLLVLKQEGPTDWITIYRDEMRNVAEMQKAGMTLLAGTDIGAPLLVPGFSLHHELALLVSVAGMTPLQALQAASVAAARVVGVADSLGSVDVGKTADLVVLEANPLLDIRHTKQIDAVISNGRLLDRAALDRMLAEAATAARDARFRPS
jgi:predicted amidohydrolase YtcJ